MASVTTARAQGLLNLLATANLGGPITTLDELVHHSLKISSDLGAGVLLNGYGGDRLFSHAMWQFIDDAKLS